MPNNKLVNKQKRSKNFKRISAAVIIWLIVNLIYLTTDYLNLFSVIGINTEQINFDFASIVISNGVVILLYIITYLALDSRDIKKKKNQRATAELLLLSTYKETLETVKLFQKDEAAKAAQRHCQPNKLNFQDPVMQQYINLPFTYNDMICEFAKEGVIADNEFNDYIKIRKLYKSHINIRVGFADLKGAEKHKRDELLKVLNENINKYKKRENEV